MDTHTHTNGQTNTHDLKHYLPTYAGGNSIMYDTIGLNGLSTQDNKDNKHEY